MKNVKREMTFHSGQKFPYAVFIAVEAGWPSSVGLKLYDKIGILAEKSALRKGRNLHN